ncbi:MAG: DUF1501 domain-containing protein [Gemmataceae bacterium]|nr:DUF1501 domain-containing protein [Gemmataceae bacterium]
MKRRDFLKVGVLGSLVPWLRTLRADQVNPATRSAILVFLKGGPSHQDTFDLKPEAPAEYRGEFRPIHTNVPGLDICEHLPRLAQCADRFALLRAISHNLADHGLGTRYVITGNRPTPVLRYPSLGSVASRELRAPSDLPTYVALDEDPEGPGFLGTRYGSLNTGERPRPGQAFRVRGVSLDDGLTVSRLERRQDLLDDLDTAFRSLDNLDDEVTALNAFARQARQILGSRRTREAFDWSRERPAIIQRFGNHETGLSLLCACRLIEAGVRFVTVIVDGWDTHNNNFTSLRRDLLPPFDQGLAALVRTLEEKGLLNTTALLVTGEFGRTPRVNGQAGRDHWAQAMCALLAGGRVRGGQVLGATDEHAARPRGPAFTPDDLAATFYHNLGIDPRTEYHTNTGRPVMLVRDGRVLREVFG